MSRTLILLMTFFVAAVKLPALLYDLNIEEKTLRELQQILQDFLKYLQKNQTAFFLSTYHVPDASEGGTTDKDRD